MWVFGYGSLMWKVDFPYEAKLVGHIKGYVRRFYQKSTDHRGIPSKPGRVVTLLESGNVSDEVWGIAYRIAPENVENVTEHLDYREKGGYGRREVMFYPKHADVPEEEEEKEDRRRQPPFYVTTYIGSEDNPNFAGRECARTIADHIAHARGPSGANDEYLFKLAAAMRAFAPEISDEHLFELENLVRERRPDVPPAVSGDRCAPAHDPSDDKCPIIR